MKVKKYNYYVAIADSDRSCSRLRYVTSIDNRTRMALWENGKPAREFGLRSAEDLVEGLIANGHPAVIVKMVNFFEPINPEVA